MHNNKIQNIFHILNMFQDFKSELKEREVEKGIKKGNFPVFLLLFYICS